MTQRPQGALKAPRVKAVAFLLAVGGSMFVAFAAAEEGMVEVAVAAREITAFSVLGTGDVTLGPMATGAAGDAARTVGGVTGRVALTALPAGDPVSRAAVVPVPTCAGSPSTFGVVVVALQAPVPSTVKKGTVVQLRSSATATDPAPRAVFLKSVDPPETVPAEAVAVSYAELLVGTTDWVALGPATAWALLPAASC